MKKTVSVTIEKEFEIDIPDDLLSKYFLEEFSSTMFKVKTADALFLYAAEYLARTDNDFVEGIGTVEYKETYENVDSEIVHV